MNKNCLKCYEDKDYPVDIKTKVNPLLRWTNSNTIAPNPTVNGGLYACPQSKSYSVPTPAVPTTAYFMQVLLKNADPPPPPGATEQYPTENRLGNNYSAMPGVKWFNSAYDNKGPYNIKVIDRNYRD